MGRISTFRRGGVHPADKKSLAKEGRIQVLPVPSELVVSMSQHLGAPAACLKKKGDRVEKGEKVGQAASFISADVHSPVSGVVADVRKVRLASGAVADALVIKSDEVQPEMYQKKYDWQENTPAELLGLVKDMGIVGMGGATFPTSVKLSIPTGKSVDALVINGVECEPYLTADYRLMMERAEGALEGIMVLNRILSPKKIIIGVEANKPDAIKHLEELISVKGYLIEVMTLKMKYPQGDEKQLLKATIGREIPSGKLPIDIGAVVCNIGTTYAVYEAAVFHKPLIERIITVSGEGITKPGNFLAPIGTKTSDLIAAAGGYNTEEIGELVSGGPMMGFAFADEDTPVTKGSSGILALLPVKIDTGVCVSCGQCVQHCPMGLMPNKMFRNIRYGNYQTAMELGLMDCKECGCCAYICPAHLPLVQGFKLGKKMGRKK
ncbi:MAG: electron transport complex subunit RsxC [Spirochaetales bacterium]|nr:electron transport complex subunit RsxC [Spirochaetales bacterium]